MPAIGAGHMTAFLVFPQTISVQINSSNPEAATLVVVEKAAEAADARQFEFQLTRQDLQELRESITTELSKEQLPG